MRELKFRAWDKLDKEFAQNIDCLLDISVSERVFVLDNEGGELIIEQFTGLKDKNGKEIYEGDIVTLTGEWEEIEYDDCYIIAFENGCFRVGDGYENEAGHYLSDWRIIGNIHENPELLENEK